MRLIFCLTFVLFSSACMEQNRTTNSVVSPSEDDPIQYRDEPGHLLSQAEIDQLRRQRARLMPAAKTNQAEIEGRRAEADFPIAWLEPNPHWAFSNPAYTAWQTFTLRIRPEADVDSVFVMINLRRYHHWGPPLEVAGGNRPPSESYCPGEVNDTPRRARRDGWNVHLQACGTTGVSEYILYGFEEGKLEVYGYDWINVQTPNDWVAPCYEGMLRGPLAFCYVNDGAFDSEGLRFRSSTHRRSRGRRRLGPFLRK